MLDYGILYYSKVLLRPVYSKPINPGGFLGILN